LETLKKQILSVLEKKNVAQDVKAATANDARTSRTENAVDRSAKNGFRSTVKKVATGATIAAGAGATLLGANHIASNRGGNPIDALPAVESFPRDVSDQTGQAENAVVSQSDAQPIESLSHDDSEADQAGNLIVGNGDENLAFSDAQPIVEELPLGSLQSNLLEKNKKR
jgi:hypothetical protein